MKSQFLFILVFVLFFIDCFLLLKQFQTNEKLKKTANIFNEVQSSNSLTIDNFKLQVKLGLNSNYSFQSCLKTNSLSDDMVILYISDGICGSCLQELFNYMEQLGSIIGQEKLMLIGNFKKKIDFDDYAFAASPYIKNSAYCNEINFAVDIKKQPILFVLNKNLEAKLIYIPNYYPEYKESYFTTTLPVYFFSKKSH